MLKIQLDKFCEKSPSLTSSRTVVLDQLKCIWFCGIEKEYLTSSTNWQRIQTQSISIRILMNPSFFWTTIFKPYWLTIFKVFYFLFSSCIIAGDRLKFNCRKRIQESKYSSTTKLVLNSLFLLIESSVPNGSTKVGKIYNMFLKECF